MIATIEINKYRIFSRHGVFPEEKASGNTFEVTVHLKYDISKAMESDRLEDTLDYGVVVKIVNEEMSHPSDLLEHVVGRIYSRFISLFPENRGGMICISKLNPPFDFEIESSGVKIEW